jgi:outer membrane protein assembly factor BamB
VERGRYILAPQSANRSPQGGIWTHPVITDGKLFLRDQELVFCYDVKAAR